MRNWAGNVEFSATDVVRPTSVEQLQEVVAAAPRVKALGTGHSFNRVADTPGILVSTHALDLWPGLGPDAGVEVLEDHEGLGPVAVVPGGATYAEVARTLHARGWALHNMGSLPHISVAGACATGTHGSGVGNGALVTAVVGVEMVRADGELVRLGLGDDDFAGSVLSLGMLGVVTRLWLRVEPTYDVTQDVLLDVPVASAVEHVQEILADGHSVSLFSSFARPDVLDSVWRKQRVDRPVSRETWGGRAAPGEVHPLIGLDPAAATSQRGVPGPWHQRLPHFREEHVPSVGEELQSEFFLRREHAAEALGLLREHAAELTGPLQVVEVRTIAADDLWLSPFRDQDTVAVHATWVSDIDVVRPSLQALEDLLAPFDPRPHWGKVHLGFDADRIAGLYPELPRFLELADRFDPQRCFANEHDALLGWSEHSPAH
jgi:xylitol oxidase